ncbi:MULTISPECIES: hypothetical protein [unclassified Marinovum]
MSYLNALRLHFAGQFQTNVSTVNNDAFHFNNAAFKPEYQEMQGPRMNPPNGWFNPEGDAAFRLLGCKITSAWTASGEVDTSDPVLGYIVADSDQAAPAKMVDLDPEQQLVSEIWGLTVRIADGNGKTLVSGAFEPAAFMDIWARARQSGGGDTNASAMWQSVITDVQWGDVSGSAFLTELQAACGDLLSIKFNCDGINMSYGSPDFMCGRITGTIGPATADEPKHLVLGRQFMATNKPGNRGFFQPVGGLNFFVGLVDADNSCIYLDLGNALPSTIAGGPIAELGDLSFGYYDPILSPNAPAGQIVNLGTIAQTDYAKKGWYAKTAGVVKLRLTAQQMQMVAGRQLVLYNEASNTIIAESSSGAFVRADTYVYRMSPGDVADISIYATQRGEPLANVKIEFARDTSQLQPNSGGGAPPPVGEPSTGVSFDDSVTTDPNGHAVFKVTAKDPGTPRWFNNGKDYGIDGQVYGIRPSFADSRANDPVNEANFISFLIWTGYTPPATVTWTDIHPIFQQYANLYPVMNRFLNLGKQDSVLANTQMLKLAFDLPLSDPNSMPVTRDLSPAKRQAILQWLDNPLPGDPPVVAAATMAEAGAAQAKGEAPSKGGKEAAMARRVIVQDQMGDKS